MTQWSWLERLYRLDPALAIIASGLLLALIVTIDYVSGAEISLATFYLLPILLVGWNCGFAWGLGFVALSLAAQAVLGALQGYPYSTSFYFGVALANRTITYLIALLLIWRLRAFHDRERRFARFDHLTGIANRRGFQEVLERELRRHARSAQPLCLAYFDCDDFKSVNDRGGHAEGDRLLRAVAQTLIANVRASDVVGRVGGDEFAILFPETDGEALQPAIEKLRAALAELCARDRWPVTFSMGITTFRNPMPGPDAAVAAADMVMYRAKAGGKNQVAYSRFPDASTPDAMLARRRHARAD
jgi:diguanylate cyclase (GGDEF)-like protein